MASRWPQRCGNERSKTMSPSPHPRSCCYSSTCEEGLPIWKAHCRQYYLTSLGRWAMSRSELQTPCMKAPSPALPVTSCACRVPVRHREPGALGRDNEDCYRQVRDCSCHDRPLDQRIAKCSLTGSFILAGIHDTRKHAARDLHLSARASGSTVRSNGEPWSA